MSIVSSGYLIKHGDKSTIYEDNLQNRQIAGMGVFIPDPDEFPVLFQKMIARADYHNLILPIGDEEHDVLILPKEPDGLQTFVINSIAEAKKAGIPVIESGRTENPLPKQVVQESISKPAPSVSIEEATTGLEKLKNSVNKDGVKGWKGLSLEDRTLYSQYTRVVTKGK